jgi:DNA-binding NarL/FixJ family response regulator
VAVLADALRRIGDGECVIDPTIVSRLVTRRRSGPLEELTEREREVLSLMAEGHQRGHWPTSAYHRRVVAVLTFLRS